MASQKTDEGNSSGSSITNRNYNCTNNDQRNQSFRNLKIYAKQMLKNRIFLGNYIEKHFVDKLQIYKDLVQLNKSENILIDDITKVLQRIQNFYNCNKQLSDNIWIGYTNPNMIGSPLMGHCIWTTFDNDNNDILPFGQYWFQIKSIKFTDQSIEIELKTLRSVGETFSTTSFIADSGNVIEYLNDTFTNVNWKELLISWRQAINQNAFRFLSEEVTIENIKKCIRLIGLMIVLIFSGLLQLTKYLGEFTLRFIQEFTKFIHVATPIMITIVNTMGKIVGGLYILLAMMWRDAFGGGGRGQAPPNFNITQTTRMPYNQPILQNKYQSYRAIQSSSYSKNQKLL